MSFKPVKVLCVVGARPNFVKMAPLWEALEILPGWELCLVHTGQHFDEQMSAVFLRQLELPAPHYHLGVQGGSATEQTGRILLALEPVLLSEKPNLVLVVGDVNSTLAAALAAAQHAIPVAHVEAGLRSGDAQMPEERNRILTDLLASFHFVSEASGMSHLKKEGIPAEGIHLVGNVMIDALVKFRSRAEQLNLGIELGLQAQSYALVTLHRPANVDDPVVLRRALKVLANTAARLPVVFSMHPRTQARLRALDLEAALQAIPGVKLLPPQGYFEFLHWLLHARVVLTDSGGIQEETTFLRIPCLTLRNNTERPITLELGTNVLLPGMNPELVDEALERVLQEKQVSGSIPPLWDGCAAHRIASILHKEFEKK